MKKTGILLLLQILFCFTAFSQNRLTPEMLWKLGRVSDPQVSPDGNTVLYNVRVYDLAANRGNSDIYKVDIKTGLVKALTNDEVDETSAKWSTDGSKITFMSTKTGTNQIWEMDTDGTHQNQLSNIPGGINCYGFAANGKNVWYAADVKLDKSANEIYPDLPKTTGKIIDNLMYRHWDTWSDGTYSHIFITQFVDDKVPVGIDIMNNERFDCPIKPDDGEEDITWSPDGKQLAYACKKLFGKDYAISTNSDIYIYDVPTTKTTDLTEGMEGYDKSPKYSADGSKILWLSMKTGGYESDQNRLFMYDIKSDTKTELTEGFDLSVESADWAPDGKDIYFICGIEATDQMWKYEFEAKKDRHIMQITSDLGDYTSFSLALTGKSTVLVASMMSISMPTELFKIDLKNGEAKEITHTNREALKNIKMGKVEKRMIKATDGKDILTWIILPPDFDPLKKYPALLYCQGGPQSTVSQFWSYRWNFQLMAANGYVVVAPNRRGLPSFGTEWNAEISGDWGGQAMKDYISAIDEVSKEPYVNKDKIGAVGASFGGYSIYWLAGHNEDKRFKAFIAHDGVFDLESMYGTTEELWFPDHDLGGPYWQTPMPESYVKFSPNNFIKYWNTPILIVHNEKDFRVPLGQGMEAFTAAQLQNIPSRFLYFPDENHWVTKPQNSVLWQRVFFEWLDKWLK